MITEEFKKSHEAGMKAIDEFNYPFTRWNQLTGKYPQFIIDNIEKGWVEAHCNPQLHNKLKACAYPELIFQPKVTWSLSIIATRLPCGSCKNPLSRIVRTTLG